MHAWDVKEARWREGWMVEYYVSGEEFELVSDGWFHDDFSV